MIQASENELGLGQAQVPALIPEGPPPPDLARLKRMFEEARDLTSDARTEALIDQDYYDTDQWTEAEKNALRARKQPDIVINRVKPAVNGIIGVSERGKSEPRAYPRTPKDDSAAEVATDVLQYIADQNRFHRIKQDCFTDMLVPGSGAALIEVDGDNQVVITQIRWEEFFYDPRSRRRDFKDARYLGIAKWMYADDVAEMFPDRRSEINAAVDNGGSGFALSGNDDRPASAPRAWMDRKARRLMVVEMYHREGGTWQKCVFFSESLLSYGPSPYQDAKGRPDCPIEGQSAYVKRDNARYGVVRDMRGPQDEINKRRSKLLHLISVSQIEAIDPSAVEVSADVARAEAARPDGVIPYGWRKVSTSDMATGQIQLLAEAKGEMERMGPNPAVLGRTNDDASGRAVLARQQAGLVELALLYGGLEDWELRVYRQAWARAKQFWRAPQYIRITDETEAPRFVALNEPVMGPPTIGAHPETGEPMLQPSVLGYKNAVAEMDVDIILETAPDTGTLAQEQFNELVRLASSNPAWLQQIGFEDLIEMSSIPRKRQVLDKLKKRREESGQQQQQMQAQQAQLAQADAMAKIKKTQSEAALNEAKAHSTTATTMLDAHKAGVEAGQADAGFNGGVNDPSGSFNP